MKNKTFSFILFLICTISIQTKAQEIAIGAQGTLTTCEGFIVDSGLSAADYGDNETLTTTICQDGSNDPLVSLYFVVFNLGTGDFLTIYNGNTATGLPIGTYGTDELQGADITSDNIEGCLTLVFTSNGDGNVGNFAAQITCETPCDRPIPVVTVDLGNENPLKVCPLESITFDGSTSVFAQGASFASSVWDFGDGTTDNINWPTVSHSFANPGAYTVQLYLIDNNGCNSGILVNKLIYVATAPNSNLSANDVQVCVGQEVELTGFADPVTWTSLPTANFGGALFIPDDQSQCFDATLTFGGFNPSATITTIEDLEYFFINFEHSYMGDITITFICPNGQSIIVHQQGGGGTFLGEPIDDDSSDQPGIGFDYYWTPDAVNGTWLENEGGTLPEGRYESVDPFTNMIGCPLNGEWIIEICDIFGSDNGFIFDWSVQFVGTLYPDLISFTPSIGQGCDSTFISGQFITETSVDCDTITIVPSSPGDFIYTYTTFDDHGCTYTDQISITAYPGPIPTAGSDLNYCGTPITLTGSVTNPVQGINYVYTWSPSSPLNNGNVASPTILSLNESTEFTFSVYPTLDPACIVSDIVNVTIPATPLSSPVDTITFCFGSNELLVAPQIVDGYEYIWSYSINNSEFSTLTNGDLDEFPAVEPGLYQVEIVEPVCLFSATTPYFAMVENCALIIPNVFTPNDDTVNDTFEISGLEKFPGSTLIIYNRWGKEIYTNSNYRNNWTGEDYPEGTYYFVLGVKKKNELEFHEGHLTLIRN